MTENEVTQSILRGEAERLQPWRTLLARISKPAGGNAAGCDDPYQSGPLAQRQQPSRGRLHKLVVAEWAGRARNPIEALVGSIERARQRREIALFGYGVGANQHAFRADANRFCTSLGGGQDPARQQMADAIEFRAAARPTSKGAMAKRRQCRRRRDLCEPIHHSGAANGRARKPPDRHRCPPIQRKTLPASTFPQAPAKRAERRKRTFNQNSGPCHLE